MTLGGFPLADTQVATVIFLFWALATMVGVVNVMRVIGRAEEEEVEAIQLVELKQSPSCSLNGNPEWFCLLFDQNLFIHHLLWGIINKETEHVQRLDLLSKQKCLACLPKWPPSTWPFFELSISSLAAAHQQGSLMKCRAEKDGVEEVSLDHVCSSAAFRRSLAGITSANCLFLLLGLTGIKVLHL